MFTASEIDADMDDVNTVSERNTQDYPPLTFTLPSSEEEKHSSSSKHPTRTQSMHTAPAITDTTATEAPLPQFARQKLFTKSNPTTSMRAQNLGMEATPAESVPRLFTLKRTSTTAAEKQQTSFTAAHASAPAEAVDSESTIPPAGATKTIQPSPSSTLGSTADTINKQGSTTETVTTAAVAATTKIQVADSTPQQSQLAPSSTFTKATEHSTRSSTQKPEKTHKHHHKSHSDDKKEKKEKKHKKEKKQKKDKRETQRDSGKEGPSDNSQQQQNSEKSRQPPAEHKSTTRQPTTPDKSSSTTTQATNETMPSTNDPNKAM